MVDEEVNGVVEEVEVGSAEDDSKLDDSNELGGMIDSDVVVGTGSDDSVVSGTGDEVGRADEVEGVSVSIVDVTSDVLAWVVSAGALALFVVCVAVCDGWTVTKVVIVVARAASRCASDSVAS